MVGIRMSITACRIVRETKERIGVGVFEDTDNASLELHPVEGALMDRGHEVVTPGQTEVPAFPVHEVVAEQRRRPFAHRHV